MMCEDNQHIQAHMLIISACSPFFSSVLKKNRHSQPMIYMRGLKAKDLTAILDFIYLGEANIYQEDLDGFLALAEDLQLKGLTGASDIEQEQDIPKVFTKTQNKVTIQKETNFTQSPELDHHPVVAYHDKNYLKNNSQVLVDAGKAMVSVDPNLVDVKAKIYSMMEKFSEGTTNWKCTVCGKLAKDRANMARHIELHIDGVSYPCNQCGNTSRSGAGLQNIFLGITIINTNFRTANGYRQHVQRGCKI